MMRRLIAGLTICLTIFGGIATASAEGSNLTSSPVFVDLSTAPGTSISTTLQVQNNSPQPVPVSVKLREFKANGTSGEAAIYTPPASDPSPGWVHFSQTSFTAQPGVWQQVKMTIDVPKTAAFGYYYAVEFAPSTVLPGGVKNDSIKSANAVFVLLDAKTGNEKKVLEVQSFTATKKLYQFLPASFNVLVRNPGDIYIAPQGDIYISRSKVGGKTLATLDLNNDGGNILPNSSRLFSAQWNDGFPSYKVKHLDGKVVTGKNGKPETALTWSTSSSLSKFRFGKYYAHLALVYNDGTTEIPIDAVVSFWVIPWTLILLALLAIAAIIVIWKLVSTFTRKGIRKISGDKKPKSKSE